MQACLARLPAVPGRQQTRGRERRGTLMLEGRMRGPSVAAGKGESLQIYPVGGSLLIGSSESAVQGTPSNPIMGWFAKERFSRQKLASLGFSAVVAYGLLDAVTYTIAFCVAFLTIERTKQINPVQDIKAVMSLVVLMWASNNVTRPFRIGGAAAMSPFVRRTAEWLQSKLRLPNLAAGFAVIIATAAAAAFSAVGALILSRM